MSPAHRRSPGVSRMLNNVVLALPGALRVEARLDACYVFDD